MSLYPTPVVSVSQFGRRTFCAKRSGVRVSAGGCQVTGIASQFFEAPQYDDAVECRKMCRVEESLFPFRDWLFYIPEGR